MSVPKAGALAKASDWTTVFPVDTDAWLAYTPTLTQSVTVTKTTVASYTKIGRLVVVQIQLSITSAGTAANQVTIGLPVAAAAAGFIGGVGAIIDTSAGQIHKGLAYQESTTTIGLLPTATTGGGRLGTEGFTAALASGDTVFGLFAYQSAS